jgi:Copper type II ascorbate-dependent monooxygenase, C-terminal domain
MAVMTRRVAGLGSALVACLAASAIAPGGGCGGGGNGGGGTGAVTYYKDVLPLVVQNCAGCHAPGGLAPFSLIDYDDAHTRAGQLAAATGAGVMPPWPPAEGCGQFRNDRRLSAAEVATFAAWNDQGAPAGNPADAPADLTPPETNLGLPSATLDPGVSYQANAGLDDDYHCFLIDPGLTAQQDLVGFDIHPGTPASVHHVLLFAVTPAQMADAQAKDDAEPGVGWTCFGGTGVGAIANAPSVIGGWVPGAGATAFPPPTGISLASGTHVIMQVHYNLLTQRDVLDRTTADLYYAATPVAKPAQIRATANTTFRIPAGTPSQTVMAQLPVPSGSYALWGVVPHMHLHGTSVTVSVIHETGAPTCAVYIPHWDFHWQQFYYYVQPIPVVAGDIIRLECTFDNSPENQPIINGVRAAPTDLTWGEATTDEMCLSYVYFTAP